MRTALAIAMVLLTAAVARGTKLPAGLDKQRAPRRPVFTAWTQSGRPVKLHLFRSPLDSITLARHYQRLQAAVERLGKEGRLPSVIVPFSYLSGGVRIDRVSYPLLKSPLIEGPSLNQWIDFQLSRGNARALRNFLPAWQLAMHDLSSSGIAHGNLHHGNVVIESGHTLRFINSETMYVPGLSTQRGADKGHPSYQHPAYSSGWRRRPYDETMDRFSGIVIYLSALALANNPSLWRRYHAGQDRLIFSDRDFRQPGSSPLFQELSRSPNPMVRQLAAQLARYAVGPPEKVPSLEVALREANENLERVNPCSAPRGARARAR